jgi:hypothetical protein
MTEDRSDSSEKFREFIKKMAGLIVPEDDVEDMRGRRKRAAHAYSYPSCRGVARKPQSR